jgi:hypothetical protein
MTRFVTKFPHSRELPKARDALAGLGLRYDSMLVGAVGVTDET